MATAFEEAAARVAGGADARDEAAALVAEMTLEERRWCLDGDDPFWAGLEDMGADGYHRRPFPAAQVPRLGVPGFRFSDGPRGVVIGPATAFPVPMARGATWDPDLEERIGGAIGRELRAIGATLYGGVCVNVLRHPAWGRAQETYGEDPHHVGELGAALARGVQRHAMACVKHFACNSMEDARFSVDVSVDEAALHEVFLPHFRRIVDEGVASVMSAYNAVEGEWCGQNRMLLTDVLRGEWGFDGFVISDWIFGLRDAGPSVRRRARCRDALPDDPGVRARSSPGRGRVHRGRGHRRGGQRGGHPPALPRGPRCAPPDPRRAGLRTPPRPGPGGRHQGGRPAAQRAGRWPPAPAPRPGWPRARGRRRPARRGAQPR
ncbi:MAG: glycoside hydrolase family 3 N-terminal domain-containing protein [Acidimicrobiales bacterium]